MRGCESRMRFKTCSGLPLEYWLYFGQSRKLSILCACLRACMYQYKRVFMCNCNASYRRHAASKTYHDTSLALTSPGILQETYINQVVLCVSI